MVFDSSSSPTPRPFVFMADESVIKETKRIIEDFSLSFWREEMEVSSMRLRKEEAENLLEVLSGQFPHLSFCP